MRLKVLKVALPVPFPEPFDYLPPKGLNHDACPAGSRILVSFGRKQLIGVVLEQGPSDLPAEKLKPAEALLDAQPLLDEAQLAYLRWIADYYQHPLGEVLSTALPARLRKQADPTPAGQPGWRLTAEGESTDPSLLRRAPAQRAVLQLLQARGGEISREALDAEPDSSPSGLRGLLDKGLIEPCEIHPGIIQDIQAGPSLTAEQQHAVEQVEKAGSGYHAFLLEGVTGSGKTEVYLRLAQAAITQGRSMLVLVPEIGLTPQLLRRFRQRFGDNIALLHSSLNEREREQAWHRARLGLSRIVIGTRSAVLAPIADLGLIIVDEEHDLSYKQQEGFRYSARDMALVLAHRHDCPVLLGSATPSLESLKNSLEGRYTHLQLTQRTGNARPPRLRLINTRDQRLDAGLSPALLQHIGETLAKGQQALVFLNRRGFAPVITCHACGWISDCPRCDARQTLHAASRLLWCHHCGSQRRLPATCPACGAPELHPLGQGTERLEQVLGERFSDYPLLRIDRDATRRKGSLDQMLMQIREGGPALLVGTQMLAKGHHFPAVTLVGILDVDGGLFSADFRAAERMAQLVTQVAGRAGRGDLPGQVLIQTRFPDHPLLQTLVHEGYPAFAAVALEERRQAQWPPYSYQALLRAEAPDAEHPQAFLQAVAEAARQLGVAAVSLWGPVPAPMERRAGRYRAHLLLQADSRTPLHTLLRQLMPQLGTLPGNRRVRWSLDVDPQDLY